MKKAAISIKVILIVLAIAVIAGYFALNSFIHKSVEERIVSKLPVILGRAGSYNAKVSGNPKEMLNGELSTVIINADNYHAKNGTTINKLKLKLNDVKINTKTRKIEKIRSADFTASFNQYQLISYLQNKYQDIRDIQLSINDNEISVKAKTNIKGICATINANAGLAIKQDTLIMLQLHDLTAAGLPAPKLLREKLQSELNPLMDVSKLQAGVKLSSIKLDDGMLTLYGNIDNANLALKN